MPTCGINSRIQHLTCPPAYHWVTIFFRNSPQVSLVNLSSINFWSCTFLSMTCCFRCSSKHVMQTGLSGPKIISLYFVMVFLMVFSSSTLVFIQFRRGIFNFFVSSNSGVLFIYYRFCNPHAGYKNLLYLLFILQKIHHHQHHCSTCCIVVFLHRCIYTLGC